MTSIINIIWNINKSNMLWEMFDFNQNQGFSYLAIEITYWNFKLNKVPILSFLLFLCFD